MPLVMAIMLPMKGMSMMHLGDLPIAGVDVSLVGRNLAILYKNTPYSDPEAGLSAGNVQGYQSGAYPSLREVGLNLRVKF